MMRVQSSLPVPQGWQPKRLLDSREFWILLAFWAPALALTVVLIKSDFDLNDGRSDYNTDTALLGVFVASTAVMLIRFVMIVRFAPPSPPDSKTSYSVSYELWRESRAMIQYALERGRTPRQADLTAVEFSGEDPKGEKFKQLVLAHKNLSALVAPAMPKTLVLLFFKPGDGEPTDEGQKPQLPMLPWLGPVRLVRMMLLLAIGLVPLFIFLALDVGTRLGTTAGLFEGDFVDKIQTGAYLIVAAALGAAFAALFKARRYIENLSYDDQYESSYWMRFVLGLLAGLILAVMLSVLLPFQLPKENATTGTSDPGSDVFQVTVPLLALVGGFSSDLVYRLLKRVMDAIETLINGSASEAVDSQKQESEARLKAQQVDADTRMTLKGLEGLRAEIAGLLKIEEALPSDADDARRAVTARIATLLAQDGSTSGTVTESEIVEEV